VRSLTFPRAHEAQGLVVEGLSGHRPGGGEVEVAGDGGSERLAGSVHLRERERDGRERGDRGREREGGRVRKADRERKREREGGG